MLHIFLYKQWLHGRQTSRAHVHIHCKEGHGIYTPRLGFHHVPVIVLQPLLLHNLAVMRPFGAG